MTTFRCGWKKRVGFLQDFKGGYIADKLGIGPRIHGKYTDQAGSVSLVMDIVPGDFPQAAKEAITESTFRDFVEIKERLDKFDISVEDDFQFYITPNASIQVYRSRSAGAVA